MIRSMTGYGKASAEYRQKKITVEIRSLNSKQLDMNVRLPQIYKDRELDIRNWATRTLDRGRIDVVISLDESGEEVLYTISVPQIQKYYTEMKDLSQKLGTETDLLPVIMRFPDVIVSRKDEAGDEEWKFVMNVVNQAAERFSDFRENEGSALARDFDLRIRKIQELAREVEALEPGRTAHVKKRLRSALEENNLNGSSERFEQEIIFYLEKLDITEEKVRLHTHCEYFIETLSADRSEGRKLGFISQEIGREINTMGSKANDAGIQKLVVQMKDELEKIREQVNNVL